MPNLIDMKKSNFKSNWETKIVKDISEPCVLFYTVY